MKPPIDQGTVLLTGASAGIGEALAKLLGARVKTLILVARRQERLEALKDTLEAQHKGLQVLVRPCDLCDIDAVTTLVDQLEAEVGVIDVLINNAGFGDTGVFEYADWEKLQRMIQLNITSLTYLTHRLVGPMVKQGKGGVLNISSGFGLVFMPGFSVYAGTKHYVTAFTEALRIELIGKGIVVTQVCPGPVDTEFESVAGNPVDQSPPAFVTISGEQCARESLNGFMRGKAMVTTGFWIKILMFFTRITPRWVLRPFFRPAASFLYKKQQQKRALTD